MCPARLRHLASTPTDLQYDEHLKPNGSNMDYDGALAKNGQEKQLECILVSIMKVSKEFVDILKIEQKLLTQRTESRYLAFKIKIQCMCYTFNFNFIIISYIT